MQCLQRFYFNFTNEDRNRIYQAWLMQTEKSALEGKRIMPETRFTVTLLQVIIELLPFLVFCNNQLRIDIFHIVSAYACICHMMRYFSIIDESFTDGANGFCIFSSGGYFVPGIGTILAILVMGHPRNIFIKLF